MNDNLEVKIKSLTVYWDNGESQEYGNVTGLDVVEKAGKTFLAIADNDTRTSEMINMDYVKAYVAEYDWVN